MVVTCDARQMFVTFTHHHIFKALDKTKIDSDEAAAIIGENINAQFLCTVSELTFESHFGRKIVMKNFFFLKIGIRNNIFPF